MFNPTIMTNAVPTTVYTINKQEVKKIPGKGQLETSALLENDALDSGTQSTGVEGEGEKGKAKLHNQIDPTTEQNPL